MTVAVPALVDDLFRRSAGRIVAVLTHRFGAQHLELVEESVQDALVRALELWPHRGLPAQPEAWLLQTARNRALDRLRRAQNLERLLARTDASGSTEVAGPDVALGSGDVGADDPELALIFLCAHPVLAPEARVALTLKLAGGFGVTEIARALLARPDAVAQRLVRAKRALREAGNPLELTAAERRERLPAVLEVIYLVFTEGYQATQGDAAVRRDLCREAIRLGRLVAGAPETAAPAARALLALMLLQGSRLPERPDDEIRLLDAQRREHWDRTAIAEGLRLLGAAADGTELTEYHLEAGIAAEHASAASWEDTNWERILRYYELLRARSSSPVLAVGHAVAVHMARGAAAAAPLFAALAEDPRLDRYFPCHVATARNAEERGAGALARAHYQRALELPCSEPEARFVRARLDALA